MLHRRLFVLLVVCLTVFKLSQVAAQDEITPFIPTVQWFEPNQGQSDPQFAYMAQDRGYKVFLGHTEVAYSLLQPNQSDKLAHRGEMTFVNIHMQLMGANANPKIVGEGLLPGVSNYFNSKGSFTNIPHYEGIRYNNLYSGIDMTYYSSHDGLQYDFHIAAGADPKQIRLHFTEVEWLDVAPNGDLLIHAANNSTLTHKTPYSYQTLNGARQEVHTRYVLLDDYTVGFEVDNYDVSQALVVDPQVAYSTLIGAGYGDKIAVDAAGNAYIIGQTQGSDFPTTVGAYDRTYDVPNDGFVTKISPDGSHLIYSTLLGGNDNEGVNSIAIDNVGNAYVTGFTYSTNFPLTPNAFQTALTATMFISKLNAAGNALLYSTRFGGTGQDMSYSIAIDKKQNAYITGFTASTDLPTRNAAQTYAGGGDAFVARFDTKVSGAASLIYSTYIGGSNTGSGKFDLGHAIAVDQVGNAYIMGETSSIDFPTTANAYDTTLGGNWDNFVTRINTNMAGSTSIIYSTFLGGTVATSPPESPDFSEDIAIDSSGNAFVTGHTYEPDFPVTAGAFDATFNGPANDYDAYVAKINTNASGAASLVFSTLIGSSRDDYSVGIALGKYGVYIVGFTEGIDFPTVDALQDHSASTSPWFHYYDAFLTGLTYDGQSIIFSTYWGGNDEDEAIGIAVDQADNVYFVGRTHSPDFPTTVGAFNTTFTGLVAAYVVKIHTLTVPLRNYFNTKTPTLTWSRVTRAGQYTVQVSKSITFSLPLAYSTTVLASQLEVTTSELAEGTYYWRVSANNGLTWSAVDTFTIKLH